MTCDRRQQVAVVARQFSDTQRVELRAMRTPSTEISRSTALRFSHADAARKLEFRVHARGFSSGDIVFHGVLITHLL